MPTVDRGAQPSELRTDRLVLRPVTLADAPDVARLAGDWQVARMLADMPYPMDERTAARWTQTAAGENCLAMTLDGQMIGSISVCLFGLAGDQSFELGFWLGRGWWGFGYAREAARAVLSHTFDQAGADRNRDSALPFTSGHFVDNPASARVLAVLGFTPTGTMQQWCIARQKTMSAVRYRLPVPETVAH